MEIMYLLVPLSVVLVFVIAVIFWWSLRNGQFEDLEGPGYRVLMDDDKVSNIKPDPDEEKISGRDVAD
jgi:cbb3-type cytochrome oxidase maturation protein